MKHDLEFVACSCALSFGGNVFFPSTDVHILEGATVFFPSTDACISRGSGWYFFGVAVLSLALIGPVKKTGRQK